MRPAPWVRLARVLRPDSANLFLKLDHLCPTGSGYDRRCWALVEAAEADGRLRPGMRVIEGSDGATAVSLAWVCATKGYPFTAVLPEYATAETQELLRAYGAQLQRSPWEEGLRGAIACADQRLAALAAGQCWSPGLYRSVESVAFQSRFLAEELKAAAQKQGRIDAFVCGVGTGATLAAMAELKRTLPMTLVAVEPAESPALSGGPSRPHRLLGLGAGFTPAAVTPEVRSATDRVVQVSSAPAWEMKDRLAREEGLLVGISTGAAVVAAVQLAAELGPERTIFTLASDTGERYFSFAAQFSPHHEVR